MQNSLYILVTLSSYPEDALNWLRFNYTGQHDCCVIGDANNLQIHLDRKSQELQSVFLPSERAKVQPVVS